MPPRGFARLWWSAARQSVGPSVGPSVGRSAALRRAGRENRSCWLRCAGARWALARIGADLRTRNGAETAERGRSSIAGAEGQVALPTSLSAHGLRHVVCRRQFQRAVVVPRRSRSSRAAPARTRRPRGQPERLFQADTPSVGAVSASLRASSAPIRGEGCSRPSRTASKPCTVRGGRRPADRQTARPTNPSHPARESRSPVGIDPPTFQRRHGRVA